MSPQHLLRILACLCLVFGMQTAQAFSKEGASKSNETKGSTPNSTYLTLDPSFVVNFGGKGKLKFLRADIVLRLQDAKAAEAVNDYMPAIRHALVMLLTKQTDDSVTNPDAKEALRKEALETVKGIVKERAHSEGVNDLLFNNFIVQR